MKLRTDVLHRWLLIMLCVLCVGFRLIDVWHAQNTLDPDASVVALMAKHMAEGREFPVFFYGQPYMGSFEPAVSALLFLIFGMSGFVLCMGTALIGMCVLPVVYLWARDGAGRWAGLAALAFLAIGPVGYFPYLGVPRGGYAVIILVDALVMWLSARILVRELELGSADWRLYLALGLAAGVGWWTSALEAASLGAAGLLFLGLMRWRLVAWRVLLAGVAFFAGSAPFWLWNIRHEWASFAYYAEGAKHATFFQNLRWCLPDRFMLLMGLDNAPAWWKVAVTLMLGIGMGAGLCFAFRLLWYRDRRAAIPLMAAALFILISTLLFSSSNFAHLRTPRYLAPLIPACAVLIGAGAVWLHGRVRWAAAIPLLVLVISQAGDVKPIWDKARLQGEQRVQMAAFIDKMRAAGHDVVYCGFPKYWLNFMSREAVCFTLLQGERYAPYFERSERTDAPTVEGNFGYVREFLSCSGGTARSDGVVKDFQPPAGTAHLIARDRIAAITTPAGGDVLNSLTDGHVDTYVRCSCQTNVPDWESFTIRFREAAPVNGFRLFSRNFVYPRLLRVEGRANSSADWVILKKDVIVSGFYWSGPRPFWEGRFMRLECRFEPLPLSEMRISFVGGNSHAMWQFAELDLLEPGPPAIPESEALPDLLEALEAMRIGRLYSSRWVAIKVRDALDGEVCAEPRDLTWEAFPDKRKVNRMTLSESSGMLVRAEDAGLTRRTLASRRIEMTELPIGPWILLYFGPGQWNAAYALDHGLYWSGYACLTCANWQWAWTLFQRAASAFAGSGDIDQAVADVEEVLDICPHWQPVMSWLAERLKGVGRLNEARQWEEKSTRLWIPDTPFSICFENGLELTGLSVTDGPLQPGATFHMRYFWRCPVDYHRHSKSAFVHFLMNGESVFQDDHVLLENHYTGFQPFPMVYVEERDVCIPSNAPAGLFEIGLGLFDPRHDMSRQAMTTSLPVSRRMAILPVRLGITAVSR